MPRNSKLRGDVYGPRGRGKKRSGNVQRGRGRGRGGGGGNRPSGYPAPIAATTGAYANVGFTYSEITDEMDGSCMESAEDNSEGELMYERLEGGFSGLGFTSFASTTVGGATPMKSEEFPIVEPGPPSSETGLGLALPCPTAAPTPALVENSELQRLLQAKLAGFLEASAFHAEGLIDAHELCDHKVELLEFIGTVKPDETSLDRKTKLQALQTLKEGGLVPQSELTAAKQSILMTLRSGIACTSFAASTGSAQSSPALQLVPFASSTQPPSRRVYAPQNKLPTPPPLCIEPPPSTSPSEVHNSNVSDKPTVAAQLHSCENAAAGGTKQPGRGDGEKGRAHDTTREAPRDVSFSAAAMEDATSEKPEDDESEDAIWQQAADELMLENQDQTSDSDLEDDARLERYMAHCEAEDRVMQADVDDERHVGLGFSGVLDADESESEESEESEDSENDSDNSMLLGASGESDSDEWETDSEGEGDVAMDGGPAGLQDVPLCIGGLTIQGRYPVGRGGDRSQKEDSGFNTVGKSRVRTIPGEKARERKDKIQAKREMRAQLKADRKTGGGGLKNSGQSQQLKQIQANLTEFLHRDGDLWGLPPMTDTLLRQARQMASLFGLKTSTQGHGRKQFLLVHRSPSAHIPESQVLDSFIRNHLGGGSQSNPKLDVPSKMQLASAGHMHPGRVHRNMAKKARRALRASGEWEDVQDYTMAALLAGSPRNQHGSGKKGKKEKGKKGHDFTPNKGKGKQKAGGSRDPRSGPMQFVSSGVVMADDTMPGLQMASPKGSENHLRGGAFGTPTHGFNKTSTEQGFGNFEAHTTGYGSRIMAKMGFAGKGAGLGKSQQGIATPVEAEKRAKKLGLGAN